MEGDSTLLRALLESWAHFSLDVRWARFMASLLSCTNTLLIQDPAISVQFLRDTILGIGDPLCQPLSLR